MNTALKVQHIRTAVTPLPPLPMDLFLGMAGCCVLAVLLLALAAVLRSWIGGK